MVLERIVFMKTTIIVVLILLWVEYGLGDMDKLADAFDLEVLILLWVEYGLGVAIEATATMLKEQS